MSHGTDLEWNVEPFSGVEGSEGGFCEIQYSQALDGGACARSLGPEYRVLCWAEAPRAWFAWWAAGEVRAGAEAER